MSGGSFNYACFKADCEEVFQGLEDYKAIERYLREINKQEAANEVQKFILFVETSLNRLRTHGGYIKDVLQAAEWHCSCDWGDQGIDKAVERLGGVVPCKSCDGTGGIYLDTPAQRECPDCNGSGLETR